jgi:MFS family permease
MKPELTIDADQGVMGGILTMAPFMEQFPDMHSEDPSVSAAVRKNRSNYQGIAVSSYNLGCFFGAIITIFLGNKLGRRKMIMLGTTIMVLGAALQASAYSLEHFIIGRIITGLGNGGNTSTVPMWQSETCSAHKRGKLVMIEGALITLGITISYWVDYGMYFAQDTSACWRFPMAFQIVFCLIIMAFVMNLPESPRWLVLKGRDEDAKEVIAAIADQDVQSKYVDNEFRAMKDTATEMSKGAFSDLFSRNHNKNFHRTILAFVNQMFQQVKQCLLMLAQIMLILQ